MIEKFKTLDTMKRRLKEMEEIKKTGTSTEFDKGYQKALKEVNDEYKKIMLKVDFIFDVKKCKCCKINEKSYKINSYLFRNLLRKKIRRESDKR